MVVFTLLAVFLILVVFKDKVMVVVGGALDTITPSNILGVIFCKCWK